MQSDPTSADALYIDGLCFYLQAKLEQAITCFERAIALCAEHSNAQAMAIKAKNIKVKKDEGKNIEDKLYIFYYILLYIQHLFFFPLVFNHSFTFHFFF